MSAEARRTVGAALAEARARGIAALDAQRLLAHLLETTRTAVIAHDERLLDHAAAARWADGLARRAAGEPLAYLLGEKEFRGLRFEVTRDVLVPRPETELLVEWALEAIDEEGPRPVAVIDLGTGSGAVAVAIASARPDAAVIAVDISRPALDVAQRNAVANGVALWIVESSWWEQLAGERFDVVVANPPYVARDDPALRTLGHEPSLALVSGDDGLDAINAIVAAAPEHLRPAGWLLVEHGADQGAAVRDRFHAAGLRLVSTRRDLAGLERVTGGQAPPAS